MSTFRPPQVPQQPPTYYTPGQPLGIPKAFTDPQFQQIEAYFRQHVEIIQPTRYATAGSAFRVPAPLTAYPAPPRRQDIEALEEATTDFFTPGQPLGVPRPRQTDQVQATWRQRIEVQLPPVSRCTAAALSVTLPRQSDQIQATWRTRPDLEALENALIQWNQPPQIVFVVAPDYIGFEET